MEQAAVRNPFSRVLNWFKMASTARERSGRSVVSQALAILYCRFLAENRLRMTEYYENSLYDSRNLSLEGLRQFIGEIKEAEIHDRLNDKEWRVFSADKIVFYSYLGGLGLPIPALYAVYHPRGRFVGDVPSFSDGSRLADFLRTKIEYPFFSKPSHGGYGTGAFLVERYNDQSDSLLLADGSEMAVGEFVRQVESDSVYGYLFQKAIEPHPELAELCGNKALTVRVNILSDKNGPRVFRSLCCIPVGSNMINNFGSGSAGNLICALDPKTGVIVRAIGGPWHERRELDTHPTSGIRLLGLRLPDWEQLINVAINSARALPRLLSTHWDLVLTSTGPMLLEVNFKNVFHGPQISGGRGSFDSELREFLSTNTVL